MFNVGLNLVNFKNAENKKNNIINQPLAGKIISPKPPKIDTDTFTPKPTAGLIPPPPKYPTPCPPKKPQPLAGLIARPDIGKTGNTDRTKPMAGSINMDFAPKMDKPGFKPDGTPVDAEKAKELIDKILNKKPKDNE